MTHGGKRVHAGRPTTRQAAARHGRVRSIRLHLTDEEHELVRRLSPERRTLALILGVEIEEHIQRLGWQLIVAADPTITLNEED